MLLIWRKVELPGSWQVREDLSSCRGLYADLLLDKATGTATQHTRGKATIAVSLKRAMEERYRIKE